MRHVDDLVLAHKHKKYGDGFISFYSLATFNYIKIGEILNLKILIIYIYSVIKKSNIKLLNLTENKYR